MHLHLVKQIAGSCRKLEGCVWNSHWQFVTWEILPYSFEDKGEAWKLLSEVAVYYCTYWLITKNLERKGNPIHFPQDKSFMYQILITLVSASLSTITVSFSNTKLLVFYIGTMPDIGTFANMRKTSLAVSCLSVRLPEWKNTDLTGRIFMIFDI
jgi:hypothetical protein